MVELADRYEDLWDAVCILNKLCRREGGPIREVIVRLWHNEMPITDEVLSRVNMLYTYCVKTPALY
jgi:hypothetical protein